MEPAFSFRRASLTGLLGRAMGAGGGGIDVSGMAVEDCQARCELAIGLFGGRWVAYHVPAVRIACVAL